MKEESLHPSRGVKQFTAEKKSAETLSEEKIPEIK
jgi:hypothetical protein